ncbi:hypothetical protein C5C66_05150 [Rathayibacter toxicus]|uniref:Uncharacterized protein n=2 Tax=Rathayibacter toxicus TaxID=145458 RepID=A0A2S5Y6U7_9MICO|nr:hypothetical protein TI83_05340 [Rathayibacter toxicus]PPG21609.1 hypothetical protein C5D15_05135 [Rathayibacter toxicus]PPG46571.1 hypothetical protein C5D16_05110 [Rathayibacter toxicus]PPH23649.1 hypothetical protein C5D17_05115 [Rathayibacter toxicus]PPH57454.1 hypothetical protein C5D30_05135 [Rathayibacter toxicus]
MVQNDIEKNYRKTAKGCGMVTRRQFFVTLASTSATAAFAVAAPQASADPAVAHAVNAANATAQRVSFVSGEANMIKVASANFAAYSSVPFVQSHAVQFTNPVPFRVAIEFDRRIFNAGDTAVVSCGERYHAATTTLTAGEGQSPSHLQYDVPDIFDGRADAAVLLALPLTMQDIYPADGVDAPLPLVLSIFDDKDVELARREWKVTETKDLTTVWGAELTASWASTAVIDGVRTNPNGYRYPSALRCSSVGPHAIPVGSTLTIELDNTVLGSCTVAQVTSTSLVASATAQAATTAAGSVVAPAPASTPWAADAYAVESATQDHVLRTKITFMREIPAGSAVAIDLAVSQKSGNPTTTSFVYASAALAGPSGDDHWQRATGKYLVKDVIGLGNPRVSGTAEEKISRDKSNG